MHVELIDKLRCSAAHESGWLVVAATQTVEREIVEGTLGCPACGLEFEIRGGTAWYGAADPAPAAPAISPDEDEATRLAALLGLDERGGFYVLCGDWGALAQALAAIAPVTLLLVSPRADVPGQSTLRGAANALPLAPGAARGIAIDRASAALAEAAARVLGARGRLVAPAHTPVPPGMALLARDARHWVGEREPVGTTSAPVMPRRAAPRTESR